MAFKFPAFIRQIKSSEEKPTNKLVTLIQQQGIIMHSQMHLQLAQSVAVKMLSS